MKQKEKGQIQPYLLLRSVALSLHRLEICSVST